MAAIHGTVVDASGRPVAGARVFFVAAPGPIPEVAALSDGGGRFALAAALPGHYRVSCMSDAAGSGAADVAVGSGDADVVLWLGG